MKITSYLILFVMIHLQIHASPSYVSETCPIPSGEPAHLSGRNINEKGDVLFCTNLGIYSIYHVWYKNGQIQKLGDEIWCKIGNNGMVIGHHGGGSKLGAPIYWTQTSGIQKLELENDFYQDNELKDINGVGQIIGNYRKHGRQRAFMWQNGQSKDLGIDQAAIQLGFDVANVHALWINEIGTILGGFNCLESLDNYFYFLWDGQNLDIVGMPSDPQVVKIKPIGIDNHNRVLMEAWTKRGQYCAFWSKNEGYKFIAKAFLPIKMNGNGEILGKYENSFQWKVMRENGEQFNLPYFASAKDINTQGVILGESPWSLPMVGSGDDVVRLLPN